MDKEKRESLQGTHVVVGIISRLNEDRKEYLLMASKRNFGEFTGFLYPPGGHLEPDEDEKMALEREVAEELGIKVNPVRKIATTPGDIKGQTTHWWECSINNCDLVIDGEEVSEVGWFTRKEILEHQRVWPATKKFFEEYISD